MAEQPSFSRADAVPGARAAIAAIFAEGFSQWLHYFSRDESRLARAFAHMFVLEDFHCALLDGRVIAMAACTDGRSSVRLEGRELRKHLGIVRGTIARIVLKSEFERSADVTTPDTGSIEFVGTASGFRRRGIAEALLRHLLATMPYSSFVIEVADTNIAALRLYQKLGFEEYRRREHTAKEARSSGVNAIIFLRRPAG